MVLSATAGCSSSSDGRVASAADGTTTSTSPATATALTESTVSAAAVAPTTVAAPASSDGAVTVTTAPDVSTPASTASTAPTVVEPTGRVVLLGDSITAELCPVLPDASCHAYPGAFVAGRVGENYVEQFIGEAAVQPGDAVVFSNISGWQSPGVDDAEIIRRVLAALDELRGIGARTVVMVAPPEGFPACGDSPTPEAIQLFGGVRESSCRTMVAIAAAVRAAGVDTIPIEGERAADGIPLTPAASAQLAVAVQAWLDA